MAPQLVVTVNFEKADDFHYELVMSDWNRFLEEVLQDFGRLYHLH